MKTNARKYISLLLALCMVMSLLPAAALAATTENNHGEHTGWTPLSRTISSSNSFYQDGNYYLDSDVSTYQGITINYDVTLCLNGNTLNMGANTLTVSSGAKLTICDCGGDGTITGTESYSNLNVISVEGGTLNLESGTISSTAAHSGSLISVTGGTLNVTGGTIYLNHTGSVATDGVQAVKLSNSTGSFTGGEVSLTTAVENARATTVYQEGGSVTVGGSAEIVFEWTTTEEKPYRAPGYGALCVTQNGAVTVEDNCTITASRTGGEMAGAVSIGKMISYNNYEVGTATITGGGINGFLVVYGTAEISNGSFAYIENRGTLTMTGGTVKNENGINYGIWTSVTNGKTDLSNVSITADIGIYVSTGPRPTIRDGVTINATQYGVYGNATLVGAPVIKGGTADLYIYSMRATTDYPSVDATGYTGTEKLTIMEQQFPDAHQGGYIGCAVKVPKDKASLFSLENSDSNRNFVYQYDVENDALRLYNQNAHPICGASCSHGVASHADPAWQQWTTPSNHTLTGGSYYLTGTVTLSQPITVTGDVNLCLNGKTIKCSDGSSPFQVTGGSLTICDCQTTGQLTGGITATGGQIGIYGGPISGGAYAVDLGGDAKLTLAGSPALSGTAAALKLYTKSGTTLDNAAVDATDYTGGELTVQEDDVLGGADGFAIRGGENKFNLTNPSGGYRYAYEGGGYVIRPDHTHSYTYSGSGNIITESCTCGHSKTATISVPDSSYTYTGSAITPAMVQYSTGWQGGELTPTYKNNTNAGTATATITRDNATASVTFTIGKANQAAPTAGDYTIDYANEKITSIANGCKVYIAQDAATEVHTGATVTPGTTYYIRREGDANHHPSDFTSFTVAVRPDAPSVTAVAESIKGKGDGKVTGVTTAMEYSTDGGQNLTPCTGAEITDLAAGTAVLVRVKATSSAPHGEAASCTIGASENTLTVTFEENGGSAVTEITGLSYNATITAPAAPTKTGYAFAGWYKEAACTNPWNFGSDKVTASITLYAKWTPVEYNITYNLNGGTVSGNPETYTVESEDITLNIPTRTGYTFAGWTGTDLSAASISVTIAHGSTGDRAYTATWTANTYAITYAGMDGAQHGENHPVSHTYATDTLVPNPTKDGYTFAGWLVNGTGDAVKNLTLSGTGYTADITLTAQWTLDAPTVTITGAPGEPVTYGTNITLTAAVSHAASGLTYTYQWYKGDSTTPIPGANQSTLTLKTVADSGEYTIKVTASDGSQSKTVESSAVSVTITKATPDYTVPSGLTATYGDRLSSIELPNDWAWDDDSALVGNAGEQSHSATFTPTDTANYDTVKQNITVQVNRAALTPSVASVADKTYDGNTSTTGTIKLEGAVLGENPTAGGVFKFEDAKADENKTVNVTVTLNGSWVENYELSTDTLTATANIEKATVGLTWSGCDDLVYDGEPVSVTAEATGLVGDDTCTVTVENGDKTDAGTYTAKATGLSNGNYKLPADVEQSYTIAPRPVELSWSESSFTYDGDEKTVTATITNLAPDDDCALTYSNNKKTEHGSYTAEVTALGNPNYTLDGGTDLTHAWSIGKAVVSFTVSGKSHIYDGEPKTATVTQDDGQTQIPANGYTIAYDDAENQTEAGTYDITVTITNDNFCFADGKDSMVVGKLTIGEQAVEIPAADDTAFTYNGAEQTYAIAESELYTVSGNVQKDAGTYTVTVALKDKANYVWPDGTTVDRTYTFTISPKPVTATWLGLEQVYGSAEPVSVILSGLAEGDEGLEAEISGISTEAGEHPLSASLKNYDIINSTATLRIQQKPVTITVTDNAVTVGSEPAISAPGLAESDYEVIYKDKNGNEVTPSEPGTYEVWVEITNPNYRHPDGSSEKQVGSVVVSSGTPRTYEVSFAGSGAGGSTAGMKAAGGSVITLPECGFTKPGSVFTGWKYFNVVYKPGDSFTMPSGDVTFTAQWAQSQSVGGKVQDKGGAPVEGAAVSIWQGSNKLDEDVTGSNGAYSFPDLAPGSYNVSVSTGEKTVTTVVTVDENGQVTGGNIVLSEGNISTRVDVTPGSPDVVVGGLDGAFTDADKETAASGGTVEIAVKVEQKPESGLTPGEAEQLEDKADGELGLFVDISLDKTTTPSGGSAYVENGVSSEGLLTIIVPLPTELKYKDIYTVVCTDGATGEALSSEPDELSGEYYELTEDGSGLILHVKESGVYAVGGRDYQIVIPTYPPVKTESENGSFAVSPDIPFSGQTVTITPKPDEGYTVDKVTVTDASGKAVEVSPNGDGTYSFTQPSGAVIITVTFKVLTDVSECPRDASCPMSGYTDLNMGEWYHDGIHYCLDEGLMDGVDAGMFAPNATTSRAMIVTILWRLQGSPEVDTTETFTDVYPDAWYAKAIAWAVAEGVADGYGEGLFGPNDAITREQLAAMLWRYAARPESEGGLSAFADGAEVSVWAQQAMSWAVSLGLINGVDSDRLDPKGQATRAQTATILMRFAQSMTR